MIYSVHKIDDNGVHEPFALMSKGGIKKYLKKNPNAAIVWKEFV